MCAEVKRVCWMQRVALIRHSLHASLRTNDFTFFKTLQAQAFLDGTDHVAILSSLLGGDVDTILHAIDDLNAGLAYVHQDAFKAIYDSIRTNIADDTTSRRAKIRVDVSQQRQVADFGIDKMANAALALIQEQDPAYQEAVANVWFFGATIVTDAMQACVARMDQLEGIMDDFILLEYSWQLVQTAVEASVSALRGVFNLMNSVDSGCNLMPHRMERQSSAAGHQSRGTSVSSTTGSLFRRLSTALHAASPTVPPSSARNSIIMDNTSAQNIRQSVSHSFPTNMPMSKAEYQHTLSTIPPTPFELNVNPFDASFQNVRTDSPFSIHTSMSEDPSPLEVDPVASDIGAPNNSLTWFRRLSRDLGPTPIAV